jgi:phosphatidylglycerol:prolipoprotein diacylglycerol transferase
VFNVTGGGLVYFGGLAGGAAAVIGYILVRKLPLRRFMDIIAPSLMLGLAFGRAGCLLNGCCWGGPCRGDWPFAMKFPMVSRPLYKAGEDSPYSGDPAMSPAYRYYYEQGIARPDDRLDDIFRGRASHESMPVERLYALIEEHRTPPLRPAQVLGIINGVLLAILLMVFSRHRRREGQVFALMVVLYPVTRFMLESIRHVNPLNVIDGDWTHNQVFCLFMFLSGILLLYVFSRMPCSAGPLLADRR